MSNFSENLKRLRMKKELTQKDLAEALSIEMGKDPPYGVPAVSAWEARNVLPPVSVIKGICKVLGCSIGDLVADAAPVPASPDARVVDLSTDLSKYHGEPVYMVFTNGQYSDQWGLVNADKHAVRLLDGLQLNTLTFGDNVIVYDKKPGF